MATASLPQSAQGLARRMVGFSRMLRDNGYAIGPDQVADALAAARSIDLSRPSLLRLALRPIFSSKREEARAFVELFDAYWLRRGVKTAAKKLPSAASSAIRRGLETGGVPGTLADFADRVKRDGAASTATDSAPNMRRGGATQAENLARKDFRYLSDPDSLVEIESLAERLALAMRRRLRRRQKTARRGDRLDLRRMLRASIAHGGEPIELFRRRPRRRPFRPVLLLDVSGSMSQYSGIFLRFMLAFLKRLPEGEGFLFHTRLIEMAPILRERRPDRAMDRLSLLAEGWGGGTRIGECLRLFTRHHAKRALRGRSALFILSDGYDTGEPALLGAAMRDLAKRARRVIWLNPLLGWRDYAPVAAGMAAALPHVDVFAPAHNLESLAALEPHLARV